MLKLFVERYLHREKGGKAIIEVDPSLDDKFLEEKTAGPTPVGLVAKGDVGLGGLLKNSYYLPGL